MRSLLRPWNDALLPSKEVVSELGTEAWAEWLCSDGMLRSPHPDSVPSSDNEEECAYYRVAIAVAVACSSSCSIAVGGGSELEVEGPMQRYRLPTGPQ